MAKQQLAGLRVAALAADGFEQVELTVPMKALRRHGAEVEVISLRPGKIQGMNLLFRGKKVPVDQLLKVADPSHYDALLLPGGFINPDFLRQSDEALAFVRAFDAAGNPIAVICHGPWVLASADLVRGRRLTSWPGIKDDLINAGADWEDKATVRDGNWISSRGPQDLRAFTKAMVKLFAENEIRSVHTVQPRPSSVSRWLVGSLVAGATGYVVRRIIAGGTGAGSETLAGQQQV